MLICLEGIDGSGKATQADLLAKTLRSQGRIVTLFSFPRYKQTFFAEEIEAYLNGERGDFDSVHPRLAAVLFAGDRFECRTELLSSLSDMGIVICDRYVSSNIAHQGAKLPPKEREAFSRWIENVEYNVFKLPKPDLTIFLDTDPTVAWKLVADKKLRNYTNKKRDLHEERFSYIESAYKLYWELARTQGWVIIKSTIDQKLRKPHDIAIDIAHACYRPLGI